MIIVAVVAAAFIALLLVGGLLLLAAGSGPPSVDHAILVPEASADVLVENETRSLPRGGFWQDRVDLQEAVRITYAFVAEDGVPLDVCLARPEDRAAFAQGGSIDCLFEAAGVTHGRQSVALGPGSYAVYLTAADHRPATAHVSIWTAEDRDGRG